jgi:hypothetical protein
MGSPNPRAARGRRRGSGGVATSREMERLGWKEQKNVPPPPPTTGMATVAPGAIT